MNRYEHNRKTRERVRARRETESPKAGRREYDRNRTAALTTVHRETIMHQEDNTDS